MADPWLCDLRRFSGQDFWAVADDKKAILWDDEASARRYAALPVMIALVRKGCNQHPCAFCFEIAHDDDCDGIAALKAAGEEP